MPGITRALAAGLAARADTSPLSTVCTVSNVQAALPANGTLLGIDLITSAVTASAVYNATTGGGMMKRQASSSSSSSSETFNYCNVPVT